MADPKTTSKNGDRFRGNRRVWSTGRIAAHLGMDRKFVRNEIKAGELKGVRMGRDFRVPRGKVVQYCRAKGWPSPGTADDDGDD